MYLVDTNYFVRSIVADDLVMTSESRLLFNKVKLGNIAATTSIGVIFEVVFVLTKNYEYSRVEIYKQIYPLVEIGDLEIHKKQILIEALELYSNSTLDIVDCYLITQAKNENLELLTFDKKAKNKLKELRKNQ
jgi:predicted nucleic-acid-binding protein